MEEKDHTNPTETLDHEPGPPTKKTPELRETRTDEIERPEIPEGKTTSHLTLNEYHKNTGDGYIDLHTIHRNEDHDKPHTLPPTGDGIDRIDEASTKNYHKKTHK